MGSDRTGPSPRAGSMAASLAILCMVTGSLPATSNAQELTIENVAADRAAFLPSAGEVTAVSFRLSQPADVEMRIYDSRDLLVRTVKTDATLPAGDASLSWDGRSDWNEAVPAEAYFYTLTASSPNGGVVAHDLTDLTRGEDTAIAELAYDRSERVVRYVLPGPSRVGIRIGVGNSGAMLATIVNWEPRADVAVEEAWDGIDGIAVEALELHGQYFRFPDNAVIVRPEPGKPFSREFVRQASERRQRTVRKRQMYQHSEHLRDQSYDFPVTLELERGVTEHRDGLPVVGDGAVISIDVPPEDRQFVQSQRIEIVFFLDGVFITEIEQGFLPVRWPLRSLAAPEGEHMLTVNLRGYEGYFGCASIRFVKSSDASSSTAAAAQGAAR